MALSVSLPATIARVAPVAPRRSRPADVVPPAAETVSLALTVDAVPAEIAGPGCLQRPLPAPIGARAWLVELAPGGAWPSDPRRDTGAAYFVLDGEVVDGERRHGAGTWVLVRPGRRQRLHSDTGARLLGFHLSAEAFLGAGGDPAALVGELHVPQG